MTCKLSKSQLKQLVTLADKHERLGQYVAGTYACTVHGKWKGACAIGCTIRDAVKIGVLPSRVDPGDHKMLGEATGVHTEVWYLADAIFEGLSHEDRAAWTPSLLRSIRPGVDYGIAVEKIKLRMLTDTRIRELARPDGRSAIDAVVNLLRRRIAGDEPVAEEWKAARAAAGAAARAAACAAACEESHESHESHEVHAVHAAYAACAVHAAYAACAVCAADREESHAAYAVHVAYVAQWRRIRDIVLDEIGNAEVTA